MDDTRHIDAFRISAEGRVPRDEVVVREVPFTIIVNGRELATLLCTPSGLENLATGFLLSEGVISSRNEIAGTSLNETGWYVRFDVKADAVPDTLSSPRLITSGCAAAVTFYREADALGTTPLDSDLRVPSSAILDLMKGFQQKSSLFRETGGVHSCAIADQERIEIFAEDIGRHNAVDKVFGECLLKDITTRDKILLTSGRMSSDILIKAAKRQVPLIVSPSAPTDLAVGLARKLSVTMVGFVRGQRMNVYSQNERIV